MDEPEIRYLEAIQQVVARMANNAFLIKGWTLTLVAAIFAVAAQSAFWEIVWVALLPTIAFWFLDTYYLRQERLFRHLYDYALDNASSQLFKMDTRPFSVKESYLRVAFSATVWPLHSILLICIFAVGLTKVCYSKPIISKTASSTASSSQVSSSHSDKGLAPTPNSIPATVTTPTITSSSTKATGH